MSEQTTDRIPVTPPTTENVAEMFTSGDNDFHDGNDWWPSLWAKDNVVGIEITPVDDDGEHCEKANFRAVVIEGESVPLILDKGRYSDGVRNAVKRFQDAMGLPDGWPPVVRRLYDELIALAEWPLDDDEIADSVDGEAL